VKAEDIKPGMWVYVKAGGNTIERLRIFACIGGTFTYKHCGTIRKLCLTDIIEPAPRPWWRIFG